MTESASPAQPFVPPPKIGPDTLPDDMVEYLTDRADMVEYLDDLARQNGISFEEACRAEMAARQELVRITPSYNELASIAKRFPAPQEWYDE
jgi:hypothetical protein